MNESKVRGNANIQREKSSPTPREVPETSQAALFQLISLCPLCRQWMPLSIANTQQHQGFAAAWKGTLCPRQEVGEESVSAEHENEPAAPSKEPAAKPPGKTVSLGSGPSLLTIGMYCFSYREINACARASWKHQSWQ